MESRAKELGQLGEVAERRESPGVASGSPAARATPACGLVGRGAAAAGEAPAAAVWRALSAAVERLPRGLEVEPTELLAALASLAFGGAEPPRSQANQQTVEALLPQEARAEMRALGLRFGSGSEPEAEGAARLGSVLEAALELRLEHLDAPAFRVTSGGWLSPKKLWACQPAQRAEQLHRWGFVPRSSTRRLSGPLERCAGEADLVAALAPWVDQANTREAGHWVVQPSQSRRQTGAHYTPWGLARCVAERALAPLLESTARPQDVLRLRILDPSVGGGVFLLAAAELLTDTLLRHFDREGRRGPDRTAARQAVLSRCLFGVDTNSAAAELTHLCLSRWGRLAPEQRVRLRQHIVQGDALSGPVEPGGPMLREASECAPPVDWQSAFGSVFARHPPGFDAVLGNPPWVAYVGRAAQPLSLERARHYRENSPAFRSYKTLHGVFIHRAAQLLRANGRLGLLVPTSVCDLSGYAPTREAHDGLCQVDEALPDWEADAFPGVFQPCMALLSTRKATPESQSGAGARGAGAWRLRSERLPPLAQALQERLRSGPRLDAALFGERGIQTSRADRSVLERALGPLPTGWIRIRAGADIQEFRLGPPSWSAHPSKLSARSRRAEDWQRAAIVIRQTARFPIAAANDGNAFRNSLLAGLPNESWTRGVLLAYLNASLLRWFHFHTQRDARQGMPQLKVAHLRALPAPPRGRSLEPLEHCGERLAQANRGIPPLERAHLDHLVFDMFELSREERQLVELWRQRVPPPQPRARRAPEGAPRAER